MAVSLSGMSLHTDNDNEGGWGGTDDPDDYNNAIQGTNSESWQVSKNSTETATLTSSSALSTTRGIFTFWMSSNLAPYYTDVNLELQSSTNNYKTFEVANSTNKAIGGDFVATAVDFVNKGTETGTFAEASFSVLRIIVDNSTSGNIRSVINNWIDAMYYGVGHTISGTTTGDALFDEASAVDELTANKYGVMWNYNGVIYSQGDISLNGTALTSSGETLVFVDTLNGYDTYNLDGTGTATLKNTSIIAAGTIAVDFDTTSMTSFSMTGGAVSGDGITDIGSGQTLSGVVFTDRSITTIANTAEGCTWNTSDTITVTGTLDDCIINENFSTIATSVATLAKLTNNAFISDGAGHAVELTGAAGSYDWTCISTGYDAGTSGDGVEVTGGSITGDETIHITATTGTFIINVGATATLPSVSSAGAVVNVVSGAVTLKIVVKDQSNAVVVGAYTYIDDNNIIPFILNTTTDALGEASISHSDGAVAGSTWRVRKYGYKQFVQTVDIGGLDITLPVTLITDPQQT